MSCSGKSAILLLIALAGACRAAVNLEVVDALDLPCEVSALKPLARAETALAVGEYESVALLVTAGESLDGEALRVRGLPRGVELKMRLAAPYRRMLRGGKEVTEPYMLEPVSTVSLKSGEKAVYWLTFHAGPQARPGRYAVTVSLRDGAARLALVVRPFRLRRDPKLFYGAFCGSNDKAITFRHMQDLHERGFDALQFFWGSVSMPIENDNGRMKVDFSFVDQWMADFRRAGLRGPVVWSLGNDASSHMENRLSEVFQIPRPPGVERDGKRLNFSDIHHPELNRRLRELMLAIRERAAEKKWPEIVFLIYDEPTERLMEEHENRYKFIKSFWPELRIYGVTMDRIAWAKAINHMVDILVANGDFEAIRKLADDSGKPFWLYGSASSRDQAALRHSYAWRPWQHRAEAVWFWAYNYHAGDPYDDFDSRGPDSSMAMVWPSKTPDGPVICSVSWDGMREAVDDMAYVQTLEWMLAQAKNPRARQIESELLALKKAIPSGARSRVLGGDAHDRVEQADPKVFVRNSRDRLATWIAELLQSERNLFGEVRVRKP
ncbi:MAG: glycoside hydrolase domain-containing protein [Acidobacteriota bacterium]